VGAWGLMDSVSRWLVDANGRQCV